jgi:SAM-dependent methyltransferase
MMENFGRVNRDVKRIWFGSVAVAIKRFLWPIASLARHRISFRLKVDEMATAKEHYEKLLAEYYAWMSGGLDQKLEQNRKFFESHHIRPVLSALAVDLGAGCGFQSIPLSQLGFSVIAIDSSARLLAELKQNAQGLAIQPIHDDLLNFSMHCTEPIELMVCMGDTLTHLETRQAIRHLLRKIFKALETDGRLVLTFRDLSAELTGLDRFIALRNDADTLFTCFLEYEKNHVKVHDMIYERRDNRWDLKKSFFKKIRIAPRWVEEVLQALGFKIEVFDIRNAGVCIIARKPKHGN